MADADGSGAASQGATDPATPHHQRHQPHHLITDHRQNTQALMQTQPDDYDDEASADAVYQELTAVGKLTIETMRCRVFFTGEGRNGKTSTRKALTGKEFDPDEASTRGTEQEGIELLKVKRTEEPRAAVLGASQACHRKPHCWCK